MTDEITGALNRSCLLQRLQEDMGTKIGNAALIDINVDGFKLYNEMYGYMNSDALLKFVADAIRREKTCLLYTSSWPTFPGRSRKRTSIFSP